MTRIAVTLTIKTVRGVLRPAFQMAVDDDLLMKNPFGFELVGVIYNTEKNKTRHHQRADEQVS